MRLLRQVIAAFQFKLRNSRILLSTRTKPACCHAVAISFAILATLFLLPQDSNAEVTTIEAEKIFSTTSTQRNGLAFDVSAAQDTLYIADNDAQLRAYTLDGALILGPLALPGNGRPEQGLHFIREATNIGGSAVTAGTLTYIQAGLGNDPSDQTTIYALNKSTAMVISSQSLVTDFNTGSCRPLRNRAWGLGYSTARDIFLSSDFLCLGGGVGEITGAEVTGFIDDPNNRPNPDIKENPDTGTLWLGGRDGNLSEFSQTGDLLRDFIVIDADSGAGVQIVGLAFDATGSRLWFLDFVGDVYQIDTSIFNNAPPTITSTPVTTASDGVLYSYDVEATDPDGDTLTYSLDVAPAGMSIDPASGLIQWTPAATQVGGNAVTVRASDPDGLFDTQSYTVTVGVAIPIDIDLGNDANTVNVRANGNIPVAILTTATFDALQVDALTVVFGPEEATETHGFAHVEDVDDDGDPDLLFHFKVKETGLACGDTEATLSGQTFDGREVISTVTISVVPCR
jgi:hypothetical protein